MLTMPGPQFLILFVAICVAVYVFVTVVIGMGETGAPAERRIRDPYLIAYLRGDTDESIRVATLALVLRDLLKVNDSEFRTADPSEIDRADVPIEKALLTACREGASPAQILRNTAVRTAADQYYNRLIDAGLIPDEFAESLRQRAVLIGIAVVVTVAAAKIVVALSTGHSNILFLVILAGVAAVLLFGKLNERLTRRGRAALSDLSTLFTSLKSRRHALPVSAIPEATLLAAVFGVYLPPGMAQGAWEKMFPVRRTSSSSGYDTSISGSGCGSSGGCGGGGGGCGGCGS
jgi:uncharacterized protein (TIGR04222 family)